MQIEAWVARKCLTANNAPKSRGPPPVWSPFIR